MATASGHRLEPTRSGMGPRKTMIIMVTVVGCVAILWPKVFYPMMMGNGQNKNVIKDHRGAGCCGVVLDQETFANASINVAEQEQQQQNLFRKRNYAPFVEIDSIRQERPPHLRPEAGMHPAMRERGRAIPHAGAASGERPHTAPRIVEGRPGPIPGMRPPLGAGSHQATKSANSMGFIMPLYTIGIVSFFIYTIMKLIFKKSPATPYAEIKPDPAFRNEVFTTEQYIKRPDDGTTKLAWKDHRASQQPHATGPVTNGELVASVASSASGDEAAPVDHVSVPVSELSIAHEPLSEPAAADSGASEPCAAAVAEKPEEPEQSVEAALYEPPHDPTTAKVVDGIVVQKFVPLEEACSGDAPEPEAVPPIATVPVEVAIEEMVVVQRLQTMATPPVQQDIVEEASEMPESKPIDAVPESTGMPEEVKGTDEPDHAPHVTLEAAVIPQEPVVEPTTGSDVSEVGQEATPEPTAEPIRAEEPVKEAAVLEIATSDEAEAVIDSHEVTEELEPNVIADEESVPASKEEDDPVPTDEPKHAEVEQNETTETSSPKDNVPDSEELLVTVAVAEEQKLETVGSATEERNEGSEHTDPALVLDTETSIRVNETVEDITHAAEQLVCEVLEQAECLAKQQEEEDQFPDLLPAYDPATQKLVDGLVIDRFDAEAVKQLESGSPSQSLDPSVASELEDDGPEGDSISEDTSLSVASVIEQSSALPEALITTELVATDRTSSEPVFVDGNDPTLTVETETVLEVEADEPAAEPEPETSRNRKSVSIEEVHDDAAIVDQAEGRVIEEHIIIPVRIEKVAGGATTSITEVAADEPFVESPPTASTLPSPLAGLDAIDEKQEQAPEPDHATKEALVERTLNEAAAVVNEIESIVDHIITEKLIQSGAEPPRLAASAALVVEAFESKSASVPSMVPSSTSSNLQDTRVTTNGLTNPSDVPIVGVTNPPPVVSPLAPTHESSSLTTSTRSDAFPATLTAAASPTPQVPPEPHAASSSETHSITLVADTHPDRANDRNSAGTGSASNGHLGPQDEHRSTDAPMATAAATTPIGQVPTSVSSVTNPKFLTLTLANYSTSNSSGNNSNRSSSAVPNLAQPAAALSVGGADSTDQLMELELLRKKLDETERAMTKIIANMGTIPKGQETNATSDEADSLAKEPSSTVDETSAAAGTEDTGDETVTAAANGHAIKPIESSDATVSEAGAQTPKEATGTPEKLAKKRDRSTERGTVKVMAMEVTAQRENGKRLSRPTTPLLPMGHPEPAAAAVAEAHETRSIVLDGRLPHDSKILVADSETAVEKLDPENSDEEEDAPVILSGKMTLSLINMDYIEKDATGTVAVGEIVTELHKPEQEEIATVPTKGGD
ncbi:mucin-5AC [Anopheles cruzii]|uniref:mucin-5AC n=1 Tax=Anopheles cruzii TaxID=68878 RepID=UPI0022EC8606|nr:mucin-5AC [Anopheles cruzii]